MLNPLDRYRKHYPKEPQYINCNPYCIAMKLRKGRMKLHEKLHYGARLTVSLWSKPDDLGWSWAELNDETYYQDM